MVAFFALWSLALSVYSSLSMWPLGDDHLQLLRFGLEDVRESGLSRSYRLAQPRRQQRQTWQMCRQSGRVEGVGGFNGGLDSCYAAFLGNGGFGGDRAGGTGGPAVGSDEGREGGDAGLEGKMEM